MAERLFTDKDFVLEKLPLLFSQVPLIQQQAVVDSITTYKFKKNDLIFVEGQEAKDFMCILTGKAKIYKRGVGDRDQILRIIPERNYFGYTAFFNNGKYATNAAALENALICFIPIDVLDQLVNSNLKVANTVISSLARNIDTTDIRLVNMTQKHVRGRLADSILYIKEIYGTPGEDTFTANLSRQDLADLSNMALNNAIRTLSDFTKEGIIEINRRSFRIPDISKLINISQIG